jgi:ribosomal protein S17
MPKEKFSTKLLRQMAYGELPEKVVSDRMVDHGRWSVVHEMIFKSGDRYWKTRYKSAATEIQDEKPYQYDGDEVECDEVRPVEKKVIVFEEVKP